jgi:hypothetical protein
VESDSSAGVVGIAGRVQRARRRSLVLHFLLLPLALACRTPAPPPAPAAAAPAPTRPKALVTIVVDQFAAWIAAERLPVLPATGGFARLRREGTWHKEMRYAHAITDTAPGHAALFTGRPPRDTGITANELIPPGGGKARSILDDPATRLVGVTAGATARAGSSLAALRSDTLADRFIAEVPRGMTVSLSLKDRGALFGAGRGASVALWLDTELGEMATSTAYPAPPAWAGPVAGKAAIAQAIATPWALADDERAFVAAHAETPDDQPGEGDYAGLGTTFPHPIPSAKAMRATPVGDHLLLALAREAVRGAVAEQRPLLLAVSLSAHDYVAHAFGPHSWEAWSELWRLDRELAAFFAFLDGVYGSDGWTVVLAADHGSIGLPELSDKPGDPWCAQPEVKRWERQCGPRRRLLQPEIMATIDTSMAQVLGTSAGWLDGISDPLVFLSAKGRALAPEFRKRVLADIKQQVKRWGIIDVVDVREAATFPCSPTGETVPDLVCRSIAPNQAGDFYLVLDVGVFFDPGYAPGHGESHGSPYLYDRAVPLLIRGAGAVPGAVGEAPISFGAFYGSARAAFASVTRP